MVPAMSCSRCRQNAGSLTKKENNTMVVKPSIGFLSSDSDAQLITDSTTIVTSMTNNHSYPSPTPALASVSTAINEFSIALNNAADGGVTLTAIKNAKRNALVGLVRYLASYVHVACHGDMAVLLSSGFPIQKPTRSPVGILPPPAPPLLQLGGRSGDLVASITPIAHSSSYNWRLTLASAPDKQLRMVPTTAGSITFSGLTPGEIYSVDANAIGSAGASNWSDTSVLMVV